MARSLICVNLTCYKNYENYRGNQARLYRNCMIALDLTSACIWQGNFKNHTIFPLLLPPLWTCHSPKHRTSILILMNLFFHSNCYPCLHSNRFFMGQMGHLPPAAEGLDCPPAPEKCPRPQRAWIAPGPGGLGLWSVAPWSQLSIKPTPGQLWANATAKVRPCDAARGKEYNEY